MALSYLLVLVCMFLCFIFYLHILVMLIRAVVLVFFFFVLSVGPGMYVLVFYFLFTYIGHADQSGGTGVFFFNTVNVWGEVQQAVQVVLISATSCQVSCPC